MEHHTLSHLIVFLFVGGVIGWLAEVLGLSITSSFGEFMMAILGAVILVGLTRLVVKTV